MMFVSIKSGKIVFIARGGEIVAMHESNLKSIETLPAYILATIDLTIDYKKRRLLTSSMIFDYIGQIKQLLKCNTYVAGFASDVDAEIFKADYRPCAFLGKCAYEGSLCSVVKTKGGRYLTKSKLRITAQIGHGRLSIKNLFQH